MSHYVLESKLNGEAVVDFELKQMYLDPYLQSPVQWNYPGSGQWGLIYRHMIKRKSRTLSPTQENHIHKSVHLGGGTSCAQPPCHLKPKGIPFLLSESNAALVDPHTGQSLPL